MYREKLLEAVAEISDEYMERYFAGDEFSVEEIRSAMRQRLWKEVLSQWLWDLISRHRRRQSSVRYCKILPKSGLERMCRYQSQDE